MMLAHRQGTLLNASELGKALLISTQTTTRYIDLLVDLLLIRRLLPFYSNIGKRLIKSPKIYLRDPGILHALLGIIDYAQLAGHPIIGTSWEGFVIENLLAVAPNDTKASFYRTANGAEIDLILETPGKSLIAIEIKHSSTPKLQKGFYQACANLKPDQCFVVYTGKDQYPLNNHIEVINLQKLAQIIAHLA